MLLQSWGVGEGGGREIGGGGNMRLCMWRSWHLNGVAKPVCKGVKGTPMVGIGQVLSVCFYRHHSARGSQAERPSRAATFEQSEMALRNIMQC